jgi:PAS domain S-box-containing protein
MTEYQTISLEYDTAFKSLFESAPGLFLVLLPDLTIHAVTDAYASATMTERDEIIGRHIFDVFPDNPDDANADGVSNLRASLNLVLKNKVAHTMALQKYDIRRPDGTFEERYWSPFNKPILNSKYEIVYIIHRAEDVTSLIRLQKEQTERDLLTNDLRSRTLEMEMEIVNRSLEIQKLNEELERKVTDRTALLKSVNKDVSDYKFALDASSIVAVTDQKGIIQYVNDNFCKISKYSAEDLIGQDHRIVNSSYHDKAFIRNLWVTIANGKIWKGEMRNIAKDGTIYWVDTTIVPFVNEQGKPYKYLAIRADITQRKQAEELILKLNEDLENKVKERTLELTNALQGVQAMNEMKSRFVSMASHEFRTPLSAILSSVSLIDAYNKEDQGEKRKKHVERIKSSIRNLTDILNDFLSLDKLEQGKMEITKEPFDLNDFSKDIIEEVSGMLKPGQHIDFFFIGENKVVQDKKILRNIFLNLLSNAIKYSEENKEINFSIQSNTDFIFINVRDNGIGIPEEEQENLFNKFYRARNATYIQGTGLGLNIVKKYVELLEGTIDFTSESGEGTTFTIVLPHIIDK